MVITPKHFEVLKEQCEEFDVDCSIAEEIFSEYYPFIDSVHQLLGATFDQIIVRDWKGTLIRHANVWNLLQMRKASEGMAFWLKHDILALFSLHLEYLPLIEGLFQPEINFLIYTLSNSFKPFKYRKEERIQLDEIEEVPLGPKIAHLRNNNVFKTITDRIDVGLRNSIAHMFYQITKEGKIIVEGKEIAYESEYSNVRELSLSLFLTRKIFYERFKP